MSAPKNNAVYIYDRREGNLYVLTGDEGDIAVEALPQNAKCGDSLQYTDGRFAVMQEASEARRTRIEDKFNRLFKK